MARYSKALTALLAGIAVAIPLVIAALSDDKVTLIEWLGILGALIGSPAAVALSPANRLTTGDLTDQIKKNPDINLMNITATKETGK